MSTNKFGTLCNSYFVSKLLGEQKQVGYYLPFLHTSNKVAANCASLSNTPNRENVRKRSLPQPETLEETATKIQAGYRGLVVREQWRRAEGEEG